MLSHDFSQQLSVEFLFSFFIIIIYLQKLSRLSPLWLDHYKVFIKNT